MMALPLVFYTHVADSLARLRCAPPGVLYARRRLLNLTPLRSAWYFMRTSQTCFLRQAQASAHRRRSMPARVRARLCWRARRQPAKTVLPRSGATLAFFRRVSMFIAVAGSRRTIRKAPVYAG
jgi:hypothetical protein